jgi:hypothetical protein
MPGRLVALILVALTLSPFTAPFSTCELVADTPIHQAGSISAAKLVHEMSAIPCGAVNHVLVEYVETFHLAAPSLALLTGESRFLVLRL